MKQLTVIVSLMLISIHSVGQVKSNNCYSLTDLLNQTFSALEKNDTIAFKSLLNVDIALSTFWIEKEEFYFDVQETVCVLSKNPELWIKKHVDSFRILEHKLHKEFRRQELNIQLTKYLNIAEKTIKPGATNYYFNAFVTINGIDCELFLYAMKIHNCYYLITPLPSTFITFQQDKLDTLNLKLYKKSLQEGKE